MNTLKWIGENKNCHLFFSILKHRLQKSITLPDKVWLVLRHICVLSKMKARINRKYSQWMSQRRFDISITDILLHHSTVSNCCRRPSNPTHVLLPLIHYFLTQLNINGAKQLRRKITFLKKKKSHFLLLFLFAFALISVSPPPLFHPTPHNPLFFFQTASLSCYTCYLTVRGV